MKRLNSFNVDFAASDNLKFDDLLGFLKENKDGFLFQKVLEGASQYLDLAFYYLEASAICESVARYGIVSNYKIQKIDYHRPVAQFKITSFDIESLGSYLYQLSLALQCEDYEECEIDLIDLVENHQSYIKTEILYFPQLADDYLANLINGAYFEQESNFENPKEFLDQLIQNDHDHIFGFWRSSSSLSIKQDFYVSTELWVIPPKSDLFIVLNKYSKIRISKSSFEKAGIFSLNGAHYVINQKFVFSISYASLLKAFQFISHVFENECAFSDQHDWMGYSSNLEVEVSEQANFILFHYRNHKILFWDCPKLNFNEIVQVNHIASKILFTTGNLIGLKADISCEWDLLNDESFEELCYDLIYYDPKFDNKTIRKMGKSRSRDGGRDIVVFTTPRLGQVPKKFIFQCKFLKNNRSLSASKVLDISDIIDQFDADGYGIFTSGVIDATLYDKIDAIAKKRSIDVLLFSKYEMERDLSVISKLKDRYFIV